MSHGWIEIPTEYSPTEMSAKFSKRIIFFFKTIRKLDFVLERVLDNVGSE